jgi:hypothetical protein
MKLKLLAVALVVGAGVVVSGQFPQIQESLSTLTNSDTSQMAAVTVNSLSGFSVNLSSTTPDNLNIVKRTDVPVYGLDFKGDNATKTVQTLDLQVQVTNQASSTIENPAVLINTIKVWNGTKLLEEFPVASGSFVKDQSNNYYTRLSGLNLVVPPMTDKVLTVTFSTNLIDTARTVVIDGYQPSSIRVVISGSGTSAFYSADGLTRNQIFLAPIRITNPIGGEQWLEVPQTTTTISGNELYKHDITWSGSPDYTDTYSNDPTVSAYLERNVNGRYLKVGRIPPFAYGSIAWIAGLVGSSTCNMISPYNTNPDSCYSSLKVVTPGNYYIHLFDKKTGSDSRSGQFTIVKNPVIHVSMNDSNNSPIVRTMQVSLYNSDASKFYYSEYALKGKINLSTYGLPSGIYKVVINAYPIPTQTASDAWLSTSKTVKVVSGESVNLNFSLSDTSPLITSQPTLTGVTPDPTKIGQSLQVGLNGTSLLSPNAFGSIYIDNTQVNPAVVSGCDDGSCLFFPLPESVGAGGHSIRVVTTGHVVNSSNTIQFNVTN